MKESAIRFYKQGYNCSQCVIMAAGKEYGILVPAEILDMCTGLSAGFGIGSVCSALVAGIMVLGALFDSDEIPKLRMKLILAFDDSFGCMNCCGLKKQREDGSFFCEELVGGAAEIVSRIINEEMMGN